MEIVRQLPIGPLVLALVFSGHGLRKGSLSPSGAAVAAIVGTSLLAIPLRSFGICLLAFYVLGSRATKVGKHLKAQLEEGHREAGYRSGFQVLCNSFSAFIAAFAWDALFIPNSIPAFLTSSLAPSSANVSYLHSDWCPLSPAVAHGWSRALLFAALGHFACCLGDTLASELGILSKYPPILITTLKTVPPGTNGGVSLVGTLASAAGGLAMGLTLGLSLIIENDRCRDEFSSVLIESMSWGCLAGLFGSLIDSLLGATVQRTRYSATSKRILQDDSKPLRDRDIKVVSGFNILSNNQVNLLSSIVTAVVLARVV